MSEQVKQFTPIQRCDHCGLRTPMEIMSTHRREKLNNYGLRSQDAGTLFELLACPVCEEVTLRRYDWDSPSPQPSEVGIQTLYPEPENPPTRIPESFKSAYATARDFRKIDPVAYGIMLGHLAVIRECNRKKRT